MAVPVLTPQQRQDALAKAAQARRHRAQALSWLKTGQLSVSGFLQLADTDPVLARTKTAVVLRALPGVGAVTTARVLAAAHIADNRSIGGLGDRQRDALLAALT